MSDDVCFVGCAEQTAPCINKERQISHGEVYDYHISCAGDIIIQARVTAGVDEAFQASVVLPLRKWIRLDCYIHDSEVQKPGSCLWEVGGKELRKHSLGQHPPLLFCLLESLILVASLSGV